MVTLRSCIASSSADWLLGVARLISSASTSWLKMGPGRKLNWRRPVLGSSMTTLVPVMSAGMRSGVNWMREKGRLNVRPRVRTSSVLPRPGTPSSSTCPSAKSAISVSMTMRCWPTMVLPIPALRRPNAWRNPVQHLLTDATSSKARSSRGRSAATEVVSGIGLILA
jgi:hypothetical protein